MTQMKPIKVFAVVDELGNVFGMRQYYTQASTQLKQQNIHQGRIVLLKEALYEISDVDEVKFYEEDILDQEVTEDGTES